MGSRRRETNLPLRFPAVCRDENHEFFDGPFVCRYEFQYDFDYTPVGGHAFKEMFVAIRRSACFVALAARKDDPGCERIQKLAPSQAKTGELVLNVFTDCISPFPKCLADFAGKAPIQALQRSSTTSHRSQSIFGMAGWVNS